MIDLNKFADRHSKSRLEAAKDTSTRRKSADIEFLPWDLSNTLRENQRLWTAAWKQPISRNFSKNANGDEEVIFGELRTLAGLGLEQNPPVRIAYEALAWVLHVADWEGFLQVVNLVDRPNFDLCIDTHHVLARVWGDPREVSGTRPGAASSLRDTIERSRRTFSAENIIYNQLGDGEKLSTPILPGPSANRADEDGPHSWCLYGRVFPLEAEEGAYFPIEKILGAWLVESGWKGWVSIGTFHRDMNNESLRPKIWAEPWKVKS